MDAFVDYLGRWSDEELPKAAESCRSIADAFTDCAEAVEEARDQIKQMAIKIAATVAVGAGVLATSLALGSSPSAAASPSSPAWGPWRAVPPTCWCRRPQHRRQREPQSLRRLRRRRARLVRGRRHDGRWGLRRRARRSHHARLGARCGLQPAALRLTGTPRSGSALKLDAHHAFPNLVDNTSSGATRSLIPRRGPGGVVRDQDELLRRAGSLNGRDGVFEWIVRDGKVVHRRFIPGGVVNGVPNHLPPKPTP